MQLERGDVGHKTLRLVASQRVRKATKGGDQIQVSADQPGEEKILGRKRAGRAHRTNEAENHNGQE